MTRSTQPVEREFQEGELLCRKGSKKAPMYILLEGTIVVEDHGVEFATISEAGTILGEMSSLLDAPRSANLRAKSSGRIQVIEDPVRYLEENPDQCLALARTLAARVHAMDAKLMEVRADLLKQGISIQHDEEKLPEALEPLRGLLKVWRVRL